MVLRNQAYVRQHAAAPAQPAAAKDSGFGFGDFLDIINPLQHIPVVSTIYRHLTGDKIGTPAKLAGDTLYGGLTGFLFSLGDTAFEEVTGKGVGDTVYAALIGDDEPTTAVAANAPPADSADAPAFASADWGGSPQQAAAAYRASGRLLAAY